LGGKEISQGAGHTGKKVQKKSLSPRKGSAGKFSKSGKKKKSKKGGVITLLQGARSQTEEREEKGKPQTGTNPPGGKGHTWKLSEVKESKTKRSGKEKS